MNTRTAFVISTLLSALAARPVPAADPAPAPAAPAAVSPASPGTSSREDAVVVDAKTEAVINGALRYLKRKQQPNGSWNTGRGNEYRVAMTGYVLMAYLSAGQLPGEGEYGATVSRGMNYLMSCVRPSDGYITNGGESNMYNHGIATIALAELYGQTRDPRLKPKLEQAVRLIVNCQNEQGGWRYRPAIVDGDISVTVLQLVACRAAMNSGIDVPQLIIDRGVKFVKSCYDEASGGFTYQPHNHAPGFARTAAAIYSLQVCGRYDDKQVNTGSDYLFKKEKDGAHNEYFTYGSFYAAPAQYMIGGDVWKRWYSTMNELLLSKMRRQGDVTYWEPLDSQGVGPVYATAVYTTILAMPYHYMPLYQR